MYLILKDYIDKILALVLIISMSPFFFFLIFFNFVFNGRPIFFIQERSGKEKKKINLIKLRTIKLDNKDISKVQYTLLGNFFRRSGLDEIFQLFNIIKGDLSFVGPRPLYMKYNDLYDKHQLQRVKVKPGLTGLAQIHQYNGITWEEKIKYDLKYVNDINFLLDIKIIIKTFYKIIFRIFDKKFNTISDEFKGTKNNEK